MPPISLPRVSGKTPLPFGPYLGLLLLTPSLACAALTWETQKLDRVTTSRETQVVALFPFRNTGSGPITVTHLGTDCGCTVAELSKDTYDPGEAGTLTATFTVGTRTGVHEKHIELATDEAGAKPITLTLRVDIQELVVASAQKLTWSAGETPLEKAVEFAAGSAHDITSLQISAVTPADTVATEIETIESGRKYRLKIKPMATRRPLDCTVSCLVKFGDKLFQRVPIVVRAE